MKQTTIQIREMNSVQWEIESLLWEEESDVGPSEPEEKFHFIGFDKRNFSNLEVSIVK
jgi:hypothetical protein